MKMKKLVAYGSLYMDEGETWETHGKHQIDNILKSKDVIAFGFDVLGSEEDRIEGEKLAKQIQEYAKSKRPDLNLCSASFSVERKNDKPKN